MRKSVESERIDQTSTVTTVDGVDISCLEPLLFGNGLLQSSLIIIRMLSEMTTASRGCCTSCVNCEIMDDRWAYSTEAVLARKPTTYCLLYIEF